MDEAERQRIRDLIKSKQVKPVEMTPERQAVVGRLIAGYAAQLKITQTGPNDYAITARDLETGLRGGVPGESNGVIFAGSLTKSVVMILPEDAFVVSNVCHPDATPILVRKIGEQSSRLEFWQQLLSLRLQGRGFLVFASEEGLHAELARRKEAFLRYEARSGTR